MINLNRLANAHNKFQGKAKRILAVCSAGMLRSPTIAWVLSNDPYNFNTRAAGISPEYALIPVDEVLIEWADEIVCAERDHADELERLFKTDKPVRVLHIPDNFEFRNQELIRLVEKVLKIHYPLNQEIKTKKTELCCRPDGGRDGSGMNF